MIEDNVLYTLYTFSLKRKRLTYAWMSIHDRMVTRIAELNRW